ncbi:hypothetical protein RhiirC2_790588 [Rhizophagus irregularis]|uniref:Uncharacterized protein n=1 Tax=Rhizophagus irregularis TaxID=588596 RepID=A0A2N1MKZ6_9GLOM|nr:hypothetical protein RhiirC2_790588 [Rhizophagus irregularis]
MSKDTKKFPMFSMLLDVDSYDVLIKDIKSNNLHQEISKQLRIKYLSNSAQELDEVEGKMFGDGRLIGLMTMRRKSTIKNIYFLVDTGAPKTTICEEVLRSFNLTISDAKNPIKVTLNKRPTKVELSPSESNFLGADFLDLYDAQLFADYGESYFTIKFKNITNEKTVTTYTANTTDMNPMVFAGPIFILLVKKAYPSATSKTGSGKVKTTPRREEKKSKQKSDLLL